MSGPPPRRFPLIQALRALAASAVALTHILHDGLTLVPPASPAAAGLRALYGCMPWGAGVDIFFVISGFVIVHSSAPLFARPKAARQFALRRLARIVPLYWLMTSLLLAEAVFDRGAIHGGIGGAAFILKSYFFIPCARPDGVVQPALGLGWTLNYEMFFYLVFMPFLFLRRLPAALLAAAALALFVLAGASGRLHSVVLQTWSNPIVLEFAAGMLLALLPGRFSLGGFRRLGIAVPALLLLHLQPPLPRVIAFGLPAAALVFAAVSGRPRHSVPGTERVLARLGDASYALYLVHPFVMRACTLLWHHPHPPASIGFYVLICLVAAQLAALALHEFFEKPVGKRLRRLALGKAASFCEQKEAKKL